MARSKKKKQQSVHTQDRQTPVPVLVTKRKRDSIEPEQSDFTKRTKQQHNNDLNYLQFFYQSIENFLSVAISSKLKTSKKLDIDLAKLKSDFSNKTRLPSGIMTNAATFAGLEPHIMRNFIDNNCSKTPVNAFKDHVNERFDNIANGLKARNLSFNQSESSTSAQQSDPIIHDETAYQTISVSLKKIMRKDLPEEIEAIARRKIQTSLEQASNYVAQYLLAVNSTLIAFKNTAFSPSLKKSDGFNILQLLPVEFIQKYDIKPLLSSLPLPKNMPDAYKGEMEVLFTEQHLALIHSHVFGSGAKKNNLKKHPVEEFLMNDLVNDSYSTLKSEEMQAARTRIITNIKNMWRSNGIFKKLLDRLLQVLLEIHLAGNRVGEYRSYIENKIKEKSLVKDSTVNGSCISGNNRRNIIAQEYKKMRKREQNLQKTNDNERRSRYEDQIARNKQRIISFKNLQKTRAVSVK